MGLEGLKKKRKGSTYKSFSYVHMHVYVWHFLLFNGFPSLTPIPMSYKKLIYVALCIYVGSFGVLDILPDMRDKLIPLLLLLRELKMLLLLLLIIHLFLYLKRKQFDLQADLEVPWPLFFLIALLLLDGWNQMLERYN